MKLFIKVFLIISLFICVNVPKVFTQEPLSDKQVETMIALVLPDKPPAEPKMSRKVLIFTKTYEYYHESIPTGVKALIMMGEKTGAYEAVQSEDISIFESDNLNQFDAVIMLNTMGELFKTATDKREKRLKQNFQEFVSNGKGLIGIHGATAAFCGWPQYGEMLGAYFSYHPEPSRVWIKNEEPDHPVNKAFSGRGFQITDEIYRFTDKSSEYCRFSFQPYSRVKLRVLLSIDLSRETPDKGERKDGNAPLSWIKTYGNGRVFYSGFGHFDEIYWNPMILHHYLAGIQFATGDLAADATPSDPIQPTVTGESYLSSECEHGFVNIFNGQNLSGWDGDKRYWSVKDGIIVGQRDSGVIVDGNHSFLIWQGENVKDFELHTKFRHTSGNSGIDYRAEKIHKNEEGEELKWTIEGYQADIVNGLWGVLYNWGKQNVPLGQFIVIEEGQTAATHIGSIANREDVLNYYKPDQWNEMVIVARGSHIIQRLNGYPTAELIDNGLLTRKEGLLGIQMHSFNTFQKYEFKDICLKQYEPNFGQAKLLFNGKNFCGWKFFNEKAKNDWKVENGTLVNIDTSGYYIVTEEKYTNYILRFQYRQLSKGKTTVFFHMDDLKQSGQHKFIQVSGSNGDLNNIRTFVNVNGQSEFHEQFTDPTTFRKLTDKSWYDCEITLNKDQIDVKVNNILRARATGIEISSGIIGFEPSDSNTEYRNIVLIPILN